MELAKSYASAAVETEVYQKWLDANSFEADPEAPGEAFTIVIPPPNVTGALHLGHAINNTLQDILIRSKRMQGFNVLWVPGVDHAGIATQAVVEKQLKENENKTRHDIGREQLVERIWQWKEQYGNRILDQLKRMGCSCDWSRTRFTLDEMCGAAVRRTFFKLFSEGLIFRGKRLVNWDVHLQTSISDDEVYHETVTTKLWHIRYPIDRSSKHLVVATTRPETMLGDTAVAVHPEDPRWNWAIGMKVKLPLTNRLVPVIGDAMLVNREFGTGCVKVTPAHDANDYACWQRQKGAIGIINILNPDGRLNENGAPFAGLKCDSARRQVVDRLQAEGLLIREEPYQTQVGHSDRSKTVIEPYLSDQWFVRMAPLAEKAIEAVEQNRVRFHPARHGQQYLSWLGEKRDWPISRQLWWGHRIPVWTLEFELGGRSEQAALDAAVNGTWASVAGGAKHHILMEAHPDRKGVCRAYVCIEDEGSPLAAKLEGLGFIQEADVLDTWFSSALWPFSTLGWPGETADIKRYFPTQVLVTARDIVTLWVARMVMMSLHNMGDVPFSDVCINPTILDGKGERMSKSKGNGVDPVEIIDTHGADALRFTLAMMATETQDARLPVKRDAQGRNTSDKFDIGRNFANKLWNATRFVLSSTESVTGTFDPASMSVADKWILCRLQNCVEQASGHLASYRFDQYARGVYDFLWNDYCDWYLEAAKTGLKDPARAGTVKAILLTCLDTMLRVLHPVMPFVTEKLWWELSRMHADRSLKGMVAAAPAELLIKATWPKVTVPAEWSVADAQFARLQAVVAGVRNLRNEKKVETKLALSLSVSGPAEEVTLVKQCSTMVESLTTSRLDWTQGAPADAVKLVLGALDVHVWGFAVPTSDQGEKQRAELTARLQQLEARLANPAYADKAPAHLVAQTRDQIAKLKDEIARL